MKKLDKVSVSLFKNLTIVNLFVSIGIFFICLITGRPSSVVFGSLLFSASISIFMIANWHEVWSIRGSKLVVYSGLALFLFLSLFFSSHAFTLAVVVDIVVAELLFSRYGASEKPNLLRPVHAMALALLIIFVNQTFTLINPGIHELLDWVDLIFYIFIVVKLIYVSSILRYESQRMEKQRIKEEQFIEYSAEFNNFFSHYINSPLTAAINNVEIARLKIQKAKGESLAETLESHFGQINEGLENISSTARELSLIHFIRSEVLRTGSEVVSIQSVIRTLSEEHECPVEMLLDEWPLVFVPLPMIEFTISHVISNAKIYANGHEVPILVVDEQAGYLTISVFNKGNIPEFGIDILHPFKRGTNSIEGTGFGLGLSLVNDLVSDYNCDFSLENVGPFTRCQLKLPLART
jgi:signal transduction histidine kinase